MEVVINRCYGGFSVSQEACKFMGIKWNGFGYIDIDRTDPRLVKCVKKLGEKADGMFAKLEIVDIPEDVKWKIEVYDGLEWVEEVHRVWPPDGDKKRYEL